MSIMILAIINGLITSIMLETFILSRQMVLRLAFKTAIGMSMISMISMEIAMNVVDVLQPVERYLFGGYCQLCCWQVLLPPCLTITID